MPAKLLSKKNLQVSGLDIIQANINEALAAMTGDMKLSRGQKSAITKRAFAYLNDTLRETATIVRDKTNQNMIAMRWPHETHGTAFAYYDPDKPRKTTALAGISKRKSMVEWEAGKSKHPRAKVAPGSKMSMALATMFEFGTSKMQPRPAIRPALVAVRGAVLARLTSGYKSVLESLQYGGGAATPVSLPSPHGTLPPTPAPRPKSAPAPRYRDPLTGKYGKAPEGWRP